MTTAPALQSRAADTTPGPVDPSTIIGWYLIPINWYRTGDPLRLYCEACADAVIAAAGDGNPDALAAREVDDRMHPLFASDIPADTRDRRHCCACGVQIVPVVSPPLHREPTQHG